MRSRLGKVLVSLLLGISGILAICLGGLIYVIFRSRTLLMFSWFDQLGLNDFVAFTRAEWRGAEAQIPAFLIMSAPFALWVLSYMLLIESVWGPAKSRGKLLWKWSLPSAAIGSEALQACGLLRGTFDANDLAALIAAALVGTLIPRLLAPAGGEARAAAKYPKKVLSGSIALITGLLVAGSEQRSSRSGQGSPNSSGNAALEQASGSSRGEGQSGGRQQQGQGSSGTGQQQGQGSKNGQSVAQGQNASGSQSQDPQRESGSGSAGGEQQQAQPQSSAGSGQQQDPNSQAGQSTAGQSGALQPRGGKTQGQDSIVSGMSQATQSTGSGASSGGVVIQPGGSSPFSTNGSRSVPRADPITGGFVVTPNTESPAATGDVHQVPPRKPQNFPEFR